jgi:hypothetical protein
LVIIIVTFAGKYYSLNNIRKNTRLIFILVLPVYFFIVQNSLLNKHTHFNANGIVVTHSHPVNHENGKSADTHNHSKTEICFFQSLHIDYFRISPELIIDFKNESSKAEYFETGLLSDYSSPVIQFISRGPPHLIT